MIAGGWMYTLKAKEIKLGYPAKSKKIKHSQKLNASLQLFLW